MNGLAATVDLSVFDELANIERSYVPQVDVFTGPASFWHIVLGTVAGMLPGGLGPAGIVGFGGYEVSKLAAGESASLVAGSILEFAMGLLIAAGLRRFT